MAEDPNETPEWLRRAIENPPPLVKPAEAEREARSERAFVARRFVPKLPPIVGACSARELLARISNPALAKAAQEWVPGSGNVVLLGETGLGKTHAVAYMARRVIAEGVKHGGRLWDMARGIYWIRAQQLEAAVKSHPLGRGDCPEVKASVSAELLILDDLGWESDPRIVAGVLAERYDSPKDTLSTSGRAIGEMKAANGQMVAGLRQIYGDAVLRRMLTTRGRPVTVVEAFPSRDMAHETRNAGARGRVPSPTPFQETAER